MNHKIKTLLKSFLVLTLVALSAHAFAVWTPAPANPPAQNTQPPVNVGPATQQKIGGLWVGGIRAGAGIIDDWMQVGGHLTTGSLQLTAGATGSLGKVLTSMGDTGIAQWQTLPVSGGSGTVGPGTVNKLSKFITTTTIGDSQIFDNGTNVGVGTETPAYKLEVVGTLNLPTNNALRLNNANNNNAAYIRNSGANAATLAFGNGTITGSNDKIIFDQQGNIGVGINSPTQKLDVVGNVKFSGALMPAGAAGTAGQVLTSAGAGAAPTWTTVSGGGTNYFLQNGTSVYLNPTYQRIGIATANPDPSMNLDVNGGIKAIGVTTGQIVTSAFAMSTNAADQYVLTTNASGIGTWKPNAFYLTGGQSGGYLSNSNVNGNVGIGLSGAAPTTKLEVGGTVKATGFQIPCPVGSPAYPCLNKVLTAGADGTASWQTPSGVTGSGSPGYLAKWTPGSVLGYTTLFDSGNGIGVETQTPSAKLDVNGNFRARGNTTFNGPMNDFIGTVRTATNGFNGTDSTVDLYVEDLMQLKYRGTPPSNPQPGMIYYDGTLKLYNGTTWKSVVLQ